MQEFLNQYPWIEKAVIFVVIALLTLLASRVFTSITRKILARDDNPLPQSSIFVNIVRVGVWLIGISEILNLCFGVNATTVIAAMGIGGIAISLGCQDTLANLIGGLQVSMGQLIQPGDYIEVLGQQGKVKDTTWRHTCIIDAGGNEHLVPNQLINKNSLIQLNDAQTVQVAFLLPDARGIENFTQKASLAISQALEPYAHEGAEPLIQINGSELGGLAGTIKLDIKRGSIAHDKARDLMARAVVDLIDPSNEAAEVKDGL